MKKILLSLMVLLMAGTAMADSYLTIDDFTVRSNQIGTTITVPVKAHFNGRVNGIQLDVTYPEGLTPVETKKGSDMTINYLDFEGNTQNETATFTYREDYTRLIAFFLEGGYWYPDGSNTLESYGIVKWEAGDYNQMIMLTLQVEEGFNGGDINIETQVGAGSDTRGGTVTDLGENLDVFTKVCHVTLVDTPYDLENYFVFGEAEVLHGENVIIPVSMTNAEDITAFQADLYLPEGFELVEDIQPSSRVGNHEFMTETMANGAVRILSLSTELEAYEGHEGVMFYITVKAPDDASGEFTAMLRNCRMTTLTYNELLCEDAEGIINVLPYILGDANDSHTVTVTDVVTTANYILGRNPQPFLFGAADVNGDGEITVTDAVLIARIVLYPDRNPLRCAAAPVYTNDTMSGEGVNLAAGETRTVTINLDNAMEYSAFQFDLCLPEGLTASNFTLTDRAGDHALDVNMLDNGKQRVLCYSPQLTGINGNEGALLTFEVTATGTVNEDIVVEAIEMVSTSCMTAYVDDFNIKINVDESTSVKEITSDVRIYAQGQDIIVESPVDQTVIISDIAGHAYSVEVSAGRTVIPARSTGVTLVTVGDKTAKLMVKKS